MSPGFAVRRAFGLKVEGQTSYWARVFGVRDVVLGHGLLVRPGPSQTGWLTAGMACDVADLLAAVIGWRNREIPTRSAVMLAVLPTGALVLAMIAVASDTAIGAEPEPDATGRD